MAPRERPPVSLTARICRHEGQPWLVVEAPPLAAGGDRLVVYDGPFNTTSKQTIKAEIDWAHEKTGMPRPDLYDAYRAYQRAITTRGEEALA
jgi:hypothetical protein